MEQPNLDIHSEEVTDILAKTPSWLGYSGYTWILFVVFLMSLMAFFLRYPDEIEVKGKILLAHSPTSQQLESGRERVTSLPDNSEFIVRLSIPESYADEISLGQTLSLKFDRYWIDNKPFKGKVASVISDQEKGSLFVNVVILDAINKDFFKVLLEKEISAHVVIDTKSVSLFTRILNQFRKPT